MGLWLRNWGKVTAEREGQLSLGGVPMILQENISRFSKCLYRIMNEIHIYEVMQIFRLNVLVTKSSERHLIHYLNILSNCDFSPGRLDAKSGLQIQHNTMCQPVGKTWCEYKHFFRFISFDCVKLTHDSRLSYHCRECKTSMQVLKNCCFYLPVIISAKMHPTLQMSTGLLYEECSSTSGALYHCVITCSTMKNRVKSTLALWLTQFIQNSLPSLWH